MSIAAGGDSGYSRPGGSSFSGVAAGSVSSGQKASDMSWESFYLLCFLVGFFFSLLSFLAGFGFLHLPGLHVHADHHSAGGGQNSLVNFGTLSAFLAWFGGTGYLLTRYSNILALLAFGIGFLSGLGGAAAIFWFLVKVLLADEKELDPADYDMIGTLGHVSSTV